MSSAGSNVTNCNEDAQPALAPANCSADLDMMKEWSDSLCSRLQTMDLRHASIALEWFYSFGKSKIERAEELRAIEAASKLSLPNDAGQRADAKTK